MVRRRQRPAKDINDDIVVGVTSNSAAAQEPVGHSGAVAVAGANLLEDQYFASPKRKDCRLANANENLKAADVAAIVCEEHRHKNSHNNHTNSSGTNTKTKNANNVGKGKSDRGGISGRNIGVPLATRSQTRTIENFFKANASAKYEKVGISERSEEGKICLSPQYDSQSPQLMVLQQHSPTPESFPDEDELLPIEFIHEDDHEPTPSPPRFVLNGEDTNDTEYSSNEATSSSSQPTNGFTTLADFQTHRSTLRDSHSSHSSTNTDNIFLQEPVLKLDIDKSPNQASSIKINKSFEVGAVFSSPPTNLSSCLLNGRFNQIVTLNGNSPTKRDSFGYEYRTITVADTAAPLNGFVIDHDSSSCDSGVAFSANSLTTPNGGTPAGSSPLGNGRRRKPATPHRILCPSPIKAMPRDSALTNMSPGSRKVSAAAFKDPLSPRKSQRQLTAVTCKSRRRLNQTNKDQAPYPKSSAAVVITADKEIETVIIDDEDNEIDEDVEHVVINADDEEFENVANMSPKESSSACAKTIVRLNGNTKSILNSAKHPTARQNTTNNHNGNSNAKHQITKTANNTTSKGAKPKANATSNASNLTKTQHALPFAANNGNRELTDFFPVRRSVRKTKTAVKEEMMRNLEKAVLEERAEGLKIANFEGKGRGVIADAHFQRGEFVIEYIGDLISVQEAAEREKRYALDENAGCYMYYFKHKNQQYCIDATVDTGKFGRLVNHSRTGNLVTKVVVVKQRPHLVLLAKDDIEPGEELTYDYGDRSKESLLHHPWLAF